MSESSWWLIAISALVTASSSHSWLTPAAIASVALVILVYDAVHNRNWWGAKLFLGMALSVVTLRLAFRLLFTAGDVAGQAPVFLLPQITLHTFAGQVSLLGPVYPSALVAGLTDGLRLAAIVLCVGTAATLASPRRLLRGSPKAFFELATALTIAVNLAPQLVASFSRISRAHSLRGEEQGLRRAISTVSAVLEDAFALSLQLAASMESRGFGKTSAYFKKGVAVGKSASLLGLVVMLASTAWLLSTSGQVWLPLAALGAGVCLVWVSIQISSIQMSTTTYLRERLGLLDHAIRVLAVSLPILTWMLNSPLVYGGALR